MTQDWQMYGENTIQWIGNIHTTHIHITFTQGQIITLFKSDLYRLKSCEIGPCTMSDYNRIHVNICLNRKNRSTRWRLNTNILNYANIRESLNKEIELYLRVTCDTLGRTEGCGQRENNQYFLTLEESKSEETPGLRGEVVRSKTGNTRRL